jgi:hypothetical protein
MDMMQKAERIAELLKVRKDTDAEMKTLIDGGDIAALAPAKGRAPQKCSVCDEEGHTARTCPHKERGNGSAGTVETAQPHGASEAGSAT